MAGNRLLRTWFATKMNADKQRCEGEKVLSTIE